MNSSISALSLPGPTARSLRASLFLILFALTLLTGCDIYDNGDDDDDGSDEPPSVTATNDMPETVLDFLQDENGNPPADASTLLYETRAGAPILAPDGDHLTLAEFSTVAGRLEAACLEGGTRVRIELSGLIPNGVYSMWNAPFNAPGPVIDAPNFNLKGRGVIGALDGSESSFTASAAGTATFEATTPGGALSEFGTIEDCAFLDEVEWHAVGAYHIDGQTHGPDLGPDGSAVEQFAFVFRGGNGGDQPDQPTATVNTVFYIPDFIEDADGNMPTDPATLLYETRAHQPILAPDGQHVSLGGFQSAHGEATMTCMNGGTHVAVTWYDLIPNGTYTMWVDVFEAPGYDPTYAHEIGVGPLGPQDGSQASFTASAEGTGMVEAKTLGGSLSMLGEVGDCMLTDEFEVQITAAYHIDGQTYGPELGPDGTAVEQVTFVFKEVFMD